MCVILFCIGDVAKSIIWQKTSTMRIPCMIFSCPIVDSVENITRAFRTVEYADRTELYFWVLDKLSRRKPALQLFSSLRFDHTVMSKRKNKLLIDTGTLGGWDDPRLCTIKGLIRRIISVKVFSNMLTRCTYHPITQRKEPTPCCLLSMLES